MIASFALAFMLMQQPNSILPAIGVDPKLDTALDPNISFRDENGRTVRLADYFGSVPIILTPVYYECPMLCSMQLNGLVGAMKLMPYSAGKEYRVLSISFDPRETPDLASGKKRQYAREYGRSSGESGWHFLTGDAASIEKLTDEIGFRYTYDKNTGQWAHVSTAVILTPDGHISQYFYGIDYDPADLKYTLIEASKGRIGTAIEHALMYCYQFDPKTGKYSVAVMRILQVLGLATVVALAVFIAGNSVRKLHT